MTIVCRTPNNARALCTAIERATGDKLRADGTRIAGCNLSASLVHRIARHSNIAITIEEQP